MDVDVSTSYCLGLLLCLTQWTVCSAQQYVGVPASSRSYGLDGPWGAVTVNLGGWPTGLADNLQWSAFDLYPGGAYSSYVISPSACARNSTGFCGTGGTFSPGNSNATFNNFYSISWEADLVDIADSGISLHALYYAQTMNVGSSGDSIGATAYNTSTAVVTSLEYLTSSNRSTNAVEIGYLALGAGDDTGAQATQDFTGYDGKPAVVTWNLPGYFYEHDITQSFSFGLHIGSATHQYPLSLYFGGYDKGRIIGAATTFSGVDTTLVDIVIGVLVGPSPFEFTSKTGLLRDANDENTQISVSPDSQCPYLSLPRPTCDAIANVLPVKFDRQSGFYLWQTQDEAYEKIVRSPAYLGFEFPPTPGGTENIMIKVPFALLNLTLDPLLTGQDDPGPYFPCRPFDLDEDDAGNPEPYTLGRAFLQSAFWGRNWGAGVSWLAQAPGPGPAGVGLGDAPQNIGKDTINIDAFSGNVDDLFAASWQDHWTVLPGSEIKDSNDDEGNNTQPSADHGLSISAHAGIGAGGGIAALIILAIIGTIFWRKRRSPSNSQDESLQEHINLAQPSAVTYDRKSASPFMSERDSRFTQPSSSGCDMQHMHPKEAPPSFQTANEGMVHEVPGQRDAVELSPNPTLDR